MCQVTRPFGIVNFHQLEQTRPEHAFHYFKKSWIGSIDTWLSASVYLPLSICLSTLGQSSSRLVGVYASTVPGGHFFDSNQFAASETYYTAQGTCQCICAWQFLGTSWHKNSSRLSAVLDVSCSMSAWTHVLLRVISRVSAWCQSYESRMWRLSAASKHTTSHSALHSPRNMSVTQARGKVRKGTSYAPKLAEKARREESKDFRQTQVRCAWHKYTYACVYMNKTPLYVHTLVSDSFHHFPENMCIYIYLHMYAHICP